MRITKGNIDQWMFQNVEGELSSEQAEQLSTFIIANPNFGGDFDKWNEAHFRDVQIEEFKHLNKIVKNKRFIWKNRYTFLLGLFIGTSILIPFSFTNNSETKTLINNSKFIEIEKNNKTNKTTILKEKTELTLENNIFQKKKEAVIINKDNVENLSATTYPQFEEIEKVNSLRINVPKADVHLRKHTLRKVFCRPEKTKKELRKARRDARKPEIKYAKGKGPGVIPMKDLGF